MTGICGLFQVPKRFLVSFSYRNLKVIPPTHRLTVLTAYSPHCIFPQILLGSILRGENDTRSQMHTIYDYTENVQLASGDYYFMHFNILGIVNLSTDNMLKVILFSISPVLHSFSLDSNHNSDACEFLDRAFNISM